MASRPLVGGVPPRVLANSKEHPPHRQQPHQERSQPLGQRHLP